MAAQVAFLLDQLDMVEEIKKDRFPLEAWHKPALILDSNYAFLLVSERQVRVARLGRNAVFAQLNLYPKRKLTRSFGNAVVLPGIPASTGLLAHPFAANLNLTRPPGPAVQPRLRFCSPHQRASRLVRQCRLHQRLVPFLSSSEQRFCATPTPCDSAPRYGAKNPSAYQHSYSSVVAPRPDGALGILAARACAPAAYAVPWAPPSSSWTLP
ncbi:hypothetical protein K438DRAFT_1986005 [Mycena galopus ATCC 62051]|nr:hypothetical protein K438DRAFT_1986005 [Mycena galopus ATCC 62051]